MVGLRPLWIVATTRYTGAVETFAPPVDAAGRRSPIGWAKRLRECSLARQFLLASLFVLLANGLVIGSWIGKQIEQSALRDDAAISSLYVDSIVTPYLQPLTVQG